MCSLFGKPASGKMITDMSTELAAEAFSNRNYRLAAEMYEACLKDRLPGYSYDMYYAYGDSLAKSGRIRESLDVYAHCCQLVSVPVDKLKHLASALIDSVSVAPQAFPEWDSFTCAFCEGVFINPVTLSCGHTFCKGCIQDRACRVCGLRPDSPLEPDVLIRRLVERWWGRELKAAKAMHEAWALTNTGALDAALYICNEGLEHGPAYAPLLAQRSRILTRLNQHQAALADADAAVRLRPSWQKGYYRRGSALSGLGLTEEALIAFCVGASLDKNPQHVRYDISRLLHRLLLPKVRSRCHSLRVSTPYSTVFSRRSRFMTRSDPVLYSSDCEEHSSGEDDVTSALAVRMTSTKRDSGKQNGRMHGLVDRIRREVNKHTRSDPRPLLAVDTNLVEQSDFDCVLCCRTLWRPVVTPCGHTYCSICLERCFDYSPACPLCVSPLNEYLSTSNRNVTQFIEKAMRQLIPNAYVNRQIVQTQEAEELESEPRLPVFVCTTAYPGVPCPLFVYEPRYRLMVRRCIESGNKQFGIASCLERERTGRRKFAEYGTLLEIRDCVLMGDGCSILTTLGSRRFRTLNRSEKDGYDTAQVEFIRDQLTPNDRLGELMTLHDEVRRKAKEWYSLVPPSLKAEILRSFGDMPDVEDSWINSADGPTWSWWVLAILPLGPHLQVGVLSTTSLEKRLRAIDKTLDHLQKRRENPTSSQEAQSAEGDLWRGSVNCVSIGHSSDLEFIGSSTSI